MSKIIHVALTLQLKIKTHNNPQHLPIFQAQKSRYSPAYIKK
ncbi:hypothetical protein B0F88_11359 [Methylobacter tundripaludum]|uniref:Uncharacterized protein n=1 Tax=Methylobacter tundripaludum TaxID=173365 RepID=A0A2S6GR99_9GAMM|nr:hypothetical protein B0F88_11359 [Methylobacter tundripaludum]